MRRERRIPHLMFVVCLVGAMPFARGAGSLEDLDLEASARLSDGVALAFRGVTVTLCHFSPGNPANAWTIVVGAAAVPAHLAHGDSLGECAPACAGVPSAVPKTAQTGCWATS